MASVRMSGMLTIREAATVIDVSRQAVEDAMRRFDESGGDAGLAYEWVEETVRVRRVRRRDALAYFRRTRGVAGRPTRKDRSG